MEINILVSTKMANYMPKGPKLGQTERDMKGNGRKVKQVVRVGSLGRMGGNMLDHL